MTHKIAEADKKELDIAIDKIGEAVIDIVSKLQDLKIDPNIEWVQTLATIVDSGARVSHLAFFNKDRSYSTWIARQEIVEDVEIELEIHKEDGTIIPGEAFFNSATLEVDATSPEIWEDDVKRITFDVDGEEFTLCPECLSKALKNGRCDDCE